MSHSVSYILISIIIIKLASLVYTAHQVNNMSAFSSFTNINESIFDFSKSDVTSQKYRAYIQQQTVRYEVLRNRIISSVSKEKSFYIKVMNDKSDLFSKDNYKKWTQYVWKMKNQFDMNQANEYVDNSDKVKLSFVVIFLKREFSVQLLWNAKARNNSNKKYTWKKYVDFLKKNTQRVFTKKENNFQKYKDYTQRVNQSIKNYDAHRIVLVANLHSIMKLSSAIELQNFILNLTQDNQNFLAEQNIENNKKKILKRLKYREDNERKKQRNTNKNKSKNDYNKRKKNEKDFDEEKNNNRSRFNKNRKKKSDKKLKTDNSNQKSVKSKRLWRWIKNEFKNIVDNNKCKDCEKSNCTFKNCKNKKSKKHTWEIAFGSKSKK